MRGKRGMVEPVEMGRLGDYVRRDDQQHLVGHPEHRVISKLI